MEVENNVQTVKVTVDWGVGSETFTLGAYNLPTADLVDAVGELVTKYVSNSIELNEKVSLSDFALFLVTVNARMHGDKVSFAERNGENR